MKYKYTVILNQEPDGGFVVTVPALPGCVTQGDTRDEALANVREAISVCLEDCAAAGEEIPTEVGREDVEVESPF
jgi:predicted RNase H-like HicB family nuclease